VDIDAFISQYRPLWQRLEGACADGPRGLARRSGAEISEIVSLYQQTSAHLAEARTRYRDPQLVAYLTRVVATAHGAIYGSRSRTVRGLLRLFGARYRRAIRGTWPHVAAASALLFGALALVALWTWTSPEAQAGLTPGFAEGFAERAGADPRDPSPGLSTFFLVHNFRVAVTAFALGITVLGTGYILVVNGANVGALAGVADRACQVQHRHAAAAHVGGTGEGARQLRQGEQRRPRQDLFHLEHVDAKKLTAAQPEQQQRQPIVAGQAGALVDAVKQVLAHAAGVGRSGRILSPATRRSLICFLPAGGGRSRSASS
jgi:hypothetical protein